MRQTKRAAADLPQARFQGSHWTLAMNDAQWEEFEALPIEANRRLTALFERFCGHGEQHFPGNSFRWMTPDPKDPTTSDLGAFEAHGVVVRGRHAIAGNDHTFFVTDILVDPVTEDPKPRKRRKVDTRQGFLPLRINSGAERK